MMLQVLAMVLTQFSVGSLLLVSLLPTREIRVGFFTLNSLLCALSAALALVLTKYAGGASWWEFRYFGLTVIGATLAYGLFKLDRLDAGRVALIFSGLVGLVAGLLPLAGRAFAAHGMPESKVPILFDLSVLAGAMLLGATNVGMILGHWYLMMRKLSFEFLERFAKLLLAAVGVRALLIAVIYFGMPEMDAQFAGQFLPPLQQAEKNLLFFVLRILVGVVGPGVLGFMVFRCVQEKANQAATGLLYVTEICVIFGEMFAAQLLI
jgi:hypothetical protein